MRLAPAHFASRGRSGGAEHGGVVIEFRLDPRRVLHIDGIDPEQVFEPERRIAPIAFGRIAEPFERQRLAGAIHEIAEIEIILVRRDVLGAKCEPGALVQHLDDIRELEWTVQHEIGIEHRRVAEDRAAQAARLRAVARHLAGERRRIDDEQIRVRLGIPRPHMAELAFGPAHEKSKVRRLLVGDADDCDPLPGNALVETHVGQSPDAARTRSATTSSRKTRCAAVHSSRVRAPELRIAPDRATRTACGGRAPRVNRRSVQERAQLRRARLGLSIVPMQRGAPQRQAQSCLSLGVMRSPTSMP